MQGKKITKKQWEEFLKALEKRIGLITVACDDVGISRQSVYRHQEEDEEFAEKVKRIQGSEVRIITVDKMIQAILTGDGSMIRFYLSHCHPDFVPKLEARVGEIKQTTELSPEAKKAIEFYEKLSKEKIKRSKKRS